jgi:hypothetical protein
VVEKYLRVIPKKYTQIALSMETLWDLLTLSIKEVISNLKVMDDRDEAPTTNSVTSDDKLIFTKDQWFLARRRRSRRAHLHPRTVVDNRTGGTSLVVVKVMAKLAVEEQVLVEVGNARQPATTSTTTTAITTTGPGTVDSPGVGELPTWPKLRRMGSPHYSWPMPAQCYSLEEKRGRVKLELPLTPTPCCCSPLRPYSTSTSRMRKLSSVMALMMTSLRDGTSTVAPHTT